MKRQGKKRRQIKKIYQRTNRKRKKQLGGFLNRYDSAMQGEIQLIKQQ